MLLIFFNIIKAEEEDYFYFFNKNNELFFLNENISPTICKVWKEYCFQGCLICCLLYSISGCHCQACPANREK